MKIRTLIVDDEAHARARVRQFLRHEPDFEIAGECATGSQAVATIQKEKPDLVFLDVQMPRFTGFDVCEAVAAAGHKLPLIIFVTAYDQYALQAFEVHALDYLLKPFDRERFQKALDQARRLLRQAGAAQSDACLAALLEELRTSQSRSGRLVFKDGNRVVFLCAETVDWLEADGNYVLLHVGNATHQLRETIGGLESRLPAGKFMRVSRSIIVNLDRVKEVQPLFYGDQVVILQNGTRLNMSRNFRSRLDELLRHRAGC